MNRRRDSLSLSLFDDAPGPAAAPPAMPVAPALPASREATLATLRAWSDAAWLRQLDSAMADFVARLDPSADASVLVATALLVHMEGRGHTCLPLAPLVAQPGATLGWKPEAQDALQALWASLPPALSAWLGALRASPVVMEAGATPDRGQPLVLSGSPEAPLLYLRRYWGYERSVAQQIRARTVAPLEVDAVHVRRWLDRLFEPARAAPEQAHPALDWQKFACALALRGRFSVVTGGPGTGKTYTAARLLALLFAVDPHPERLRVALAAPTGKAAARLKQSIDTALGELQARMGAELDLAALTQRMGAARTLHALLGARPDTRQFRYHAGHPLELDVLIVDEASMVHLEMMAALLEALPPTARVVFLGDKDQLASVEAGAVLGDLCRDAEAGRYSPASAAYAWAAAGQRIPSEHVDSAHPPPLAQHTAMLRESRRFGGPIGQLAGAVNRGDAGRARECLAQEAGGALRHLEAAPVAAVWDLAVHGRAGAPGYGPFVDALAQGPDAAGVEAHRAWALAVLRAFERFRVLCAVREGEWGVAGLNRAIELALSRAGTLRPRGEWYVGRPVMVTRNDAALGVFNGDIGVALPAPPKDGAQTGAAARLRVCFADGPELRTVGVGRLAHVETAFAMTVHKSQGSEFEHTALVLPPHAGAVLSRELLYTGITRARQAFTLVSAEPGLLASAVQQRTQRASGLRGWLDAQDLPG